VKSVIYLVEQPLSDWNYSRFGVQRWLDRGWNVEVWDLTQLLNPHIYDDYISSGKVTKSFSGYVHISNDEQLFQHCKGISPGTYIADHIGDGFECARVKKHMTGNGAIRIAAYFGGTPLVNNFSHKLGGLISRINNRVSVLLSMGLLGSFHWISTWIKTQRIKALIGPTIYAVSGEDSIPAGLGKSDVIAAHNMDYDLYLKLKDTPKQFEGDYALFIDQDVCFHTDFLFDKVMSPITPDKYFFAITRALQIISTELQVSLSIAGHPRTANKKAIQQYFGEIPVHFGATAELIQSCKFVAGHSSTSLQLAVCFQKPVVFLTTNELNLSDIGSAIDLSASLFGKKVINVDDDLKDIDWGKELLIDQEKYSEYKRKLIKLDDTPEKQSWDIVIDHVERLSE
jgi:hypothetical protein